jgi:NAD-dependent deacetylase
MHGELLKARCTSCGGVFNWEADILDGSDCPKCQAVGKLRPHIVWFGEMPIGMEKIYGALGCCDFFAAIGTSGHVYPAAGFVQGVRPACHTVELNLEPSIVNSAFKESRSGPATKTVPAWAKEMLSQHDMANNC